MLQDKTQDLDFNASYMGWLSFERVKTRHKNYGGNDYKLMKTLLVHDLVVFEEHSIKHFGTMP